MEITIEDNGKGFLARCASIQGAFAEGATEFEAFYNLVDVLHMITEYRGAKTTKKSEKKTRFTVPFALA